MNYYVFYYFQAFINKLKDLKKDVKDLEFRVDQLKERPEALEALRQMLNHSTYFLKSIQNLSALELQEDPIFTAVEVETLAKLINETQVSKAIHTPRVFPQGFKVWVPRTPLCGIKGSFNKI